MPPANTPQNPSPENSRPTTWYSPPTPLSLITTPVADLSLVTPTEADAYDENLRFLRDATLPSELTGAAIPTHQRRTHRSSNQQRSPSSRPNHQGTTESRLTHAEQQRDRVQRVLSRLNGLDEHRGQARRERIVTLPLANNATTQSATPGDASGQGLVDEIAVLREIIEELGQENPHAVPDVSNVLSRRWSNVEGRPEEDAEARAAPELQTSSDILTSLQRTERNVQALQDSLEARVFQRTTAESPGDADRAAAEAAVSTQRISADLTAMQRLINTQRMAATAHLARNNAQTTERMLRHIRDREQLGTNDAAGQAHESSSLLSRWSRLSRIEQSNDRADEGDASRDEYSQWSRQQELERLRQERHTSRQDYDSQLRLSNQLTHKPSHLLVTPFLENAVKYLDRIRDCTTYDGALVAAIDNGFANKEFFADKHDDFLMEIQKCRSPAESTWLRSGVRFSGSQYTSLQSIQRSRNGLASAVNDATRTTSNRSSTSPDARLRGPDCVDHWPVKVTIHGVDLGNMTLSGTMEAYDVPLHGEDRSARQNEADCFSRPPITTFLEGQIIDLQRHSFLTPATRKNASIASQDFYSSPTKLNFPTTSAASDAANWRRLPPFNDVSDDDEVARILLSHDRMAALNDEFIFMRWKERCFIHRDGDKCPLSPHVRRAESVQQSPPPASGRRATSDHSTARQDRHSSRQSHTARNGPRHGGSVTTPTRDTTASRLSATPAPPSTDPGPGPSIIAHIPAAASPSVRAHRAGAAQTGYQQPQPFRMPRAAAAPARSGAVLGEGDDTDTGHGLTIGGFYYVSLNRLSGELVGLYFDPGTTPYQCLKLKGVGGGGVGGWKFT